MFRGKLKFTSAIITLLMAQVSLPSISVAASSLPSTAQNASSDSYFLQKGRAPGLSDLLLPSENFVNSAGRFGEQRQGYFHTGIDVSSGGKSVPLRAGDNGKVLSKGYHNAAGNMVVIQRELADGQSTGNHAYRYLHMQSPTTKTNGSKVSRGEVVGREGSTGRGGIHLHLDYMVPKSQAIGTGLSKAGPSGYQVQGVKGGSATTPELMYTDPTPYLDRDFIYNGAEDRGSNPLYSPWLGNSWRWQFNTLYGTNLPTLPGSKGPTKKLPETLLTQLNGVYSKGVALTPEELAAARRSLVEASITAEQAGFDISDQWISQPVLASMLLVDDGKDFMTLPPTTRDLQLTEQSPKQMIETIGKSRYGNVEWVRAVNKLNSKGLFNEYVQMNAELEFIKERKLDLQNRIEYMLANLASVEQYAYMQKVSEIQKAASAAAPPSIIDLQLEASGDEWQGGSYSPADMDSVVASDTLTGVSPKAAKAADFASRSAAGASLGRCAYYVRRSLQFAGITNFTTQPSAYMYHTNGTLKNAGFVEVSKNGYSPKKGDVVVINRFGNHPHGHIAIFDGRQWVSDFKQNGVWIYKQARNDSLIHYYRMPS